MAHRKTYRKLPRVTNTAPQNDPLDRIDLPVIVRWDTARARWSIHGPGLKHVLSRIVELTKPRLAPDGSYHGMFVRAWVPYPSHREWRVASAADRLGNRLVLEDKIAYTRNDP